jgi:hypothetical protein
MGRRRPLLRGGTWCFVFVLLGVVVADDTPALRHQSHLLQLLAISYSVNRKGDNVSSRFRCPS